MGTAVTVTVGDPFTVIVTGDLFEHIELIIINAISRTGEIYQPLLLKTHFIISTPINNLNQAVCNFHMHVCC